MAKKRRPPPPRAVRTETRASEVVTILWMMSVVTTVMCGGVALLVWLAVWARGENPHALLFSRLLHFGAFVTAILSLVMLAIVFKVRTQQPPAAITWFSVVVAIVTLLAALLY